MLFLDTSAILALADKDEKGHAAAVKFLRGVAGREALVTTPYVFDEAVTRARRKLGHAAAVKVGNALRASTLARMVPLQEGDLEEAWTLFVRHADQKLSYTDCTSFALMRRMGIERAFAFDEDFARMGFEELPRGAPRGRGR